MSYQVFVNGDGENYWTGHDNFDEAVERFREEQQIDRKVSLVWEGFEYESE